MNTMEMNTELNFSEENLMNMIEQLLFDYNVNRTGETTDSLIDQAQQYIQESCLDEHTKFELCDYCTDIGTNASTYGYKQGIKEGVRLFRTLMKL